MTARQEIDGREGREPEDDFERTEARAAGQKTGNGSVDLAAHALYRIFRHSGARALAREPGIHNHWPRVMDSGLATLRWRPGMTEPGFVGGAAQFIAFVPYPESYLAVPR